MSDRALILVLLANPENRRLLESLLGDRYEVISGLGEAREKNASGPFDLCILDGESLRRSMHAIVSIRERFAPLFLPVLLLAERQTTDLRGAPIWNAIDDLLYRPVERIELVARVQSLLRTRLLSLQTRRLTTMYELEHTVAQRMQEAAMPRVPPSLPGLTIDAVYRPADDVARVGGDWYDAMRLTDGRVVVTIGDVSGSGLEAAVTMSQMRQVLRAVAHVHSDPALMLDAADRTLVGEPDYKQVSVFVGVIDAVASELTYASAGHPPALLRTGDGAVEALESTGLLLGTPMRLPRASTRSDFTEGSMLVLYTDGITEATRDPVEGERRLTEAVRALGAHDANPAQTLADTMREPTNSDDIAVMTVGFDRRSGASLCRFEFDARDGVEASKAKAGVRAALESRRLTATAITIAETILAELLGNVVRHTPGPAIVALDAESQQPVLHVLDCGIGFQHFPRLPTDVLSERGRGLFIVAQLAEDFTISHRHRVGSHARVVLSTRPLSP